MELRVWVDGTQRVVCGVKLTTTCQEIVFALAHATQQAGRFIMIERWRNNERLLSPNEQPLVTLQRWASRMDEVEYILRKTSTDSPANQQQPPQQQPSQLTTTPTTNNQNNTRAINHDNMTSSPVTNSQHNGGASLNSSSIAPPINATLTSANNDNNLMAAAAAPLSNNNSINSNAFNNSNQSTQFYQNTSTDQNASNNSTSHLLRQQHQQQNNPSNGYNNELIKSEMTPSNNTSQLINKSNDLLSNQNNHIPPVSRIMSAATSHPPRNLEDLYSTVNKDRSNSNTSQQMPPAVPAKPRVVAPLALVASLPSNQMLAHHHHPQHHNTAQMNYYQTNQSPQMYQNNSAMRPRNPPGYSDYIEAMANRNSFSQVPLQASSIQNAYVGHLSQQPHPQSNIYSLRSSFDSINNLSTTTQQTTYNLQPNPQLHGSSPSSSLNNYSTNATIAAANIRPTYHYSMTTNGVTASSLNNIHHNSHQQPVPHDYSQEFTDMLKKIEEQKKVLLNQKNEIDRLDNDDDDWDTLPPEQVELINRIKDEIQQLEELWKENQIQIKKLENQDFEKKLQELKSENLRMEVEIVKQKEKLTRCEKDIAECNEEMEQLKLELRNFQQNGQYEQDDSDDTSTSIDDDYEEDSGGDASDDLNLNISSSMDGNSVNANRSPKDVASVDKRGLISGIRALKLDKSRALNHSR